MQRPSWDWSLPWISSLISRQGQMSLYTTWVEVAAWLRGSTSNLCPWRRTLGCSSFVHLTLPNRLFGWYKWSAECSWEIKMLVISCNSPSYTSSRICTSPQPITFGHCIHPTQPNLIEFKRKLSCFLLSRIFKSLTCCPRPEQSLILLAHHYWYHQLTNSRFYPDEFSMITSEINAASFSLMEIDTWPRASFHSLTLATRTSHRAEYSDLYHTQNQASPHFELSLCWELANNTLKRAFLSSRISLKKQGLVSIINLLSRVKLWFTWC